MCISSFLLLGLLCVLFSLDTQNYRELVLNKKSILMYCKSSHSSLSSCIIGGRKCSKEENQQSKLKLSIEKNEQLR